MAHRLLLLLVLIVSACAQSRTEPAPGDSALDDPEPALQHYAGTGAIFGPEGRPLGEYTVDLTRRRLAEGRYELALEVHVPGEEDQRFSFETHTGEAGFSITAEEGRGGGFDLGDGMMTSYLEGAEGVGQASVIAGSDGGGLRIVRFQLEDGAPTRIFRETYRLLLPARPGA